MTRTLAGLTSVLLAIGVIYCRMAISRYYGANAKSQDFPQLRFIPRSSGG